MDNTIDIINEQSVEEAIAYAISSARNIGFNKLDVNLIASAVSEVAMNIVKYAGEGKMSVNVLKNNRGLDFQFTDQGPGIEDIEEVLKDGYSIDPSSLGVGLGATKRAMDYFELKSVKGNGTEVLISKWLPISNLKIEYGVVSLPDPNYLVNGDGYVIKEYAGDCVLVGIIDGLGEGEDAWKTTRILKEVISENYMCSLKTIILQCESIIKDTYPHSGASIGILRIEPDNLAYIGIGDTFVKVYSSKALNFNSQQGIVGTFKLPVIKTQEKQHLNNSTIILCTDGIKDSFENKSLPLNDHAQVIAAFIFNNFRRDYGDATVLVLNLKFKDE